jgi:hypothetical protein
MFTTIKGYYEQGKIVLSEQAPVSEKTEVIITFLNETSPNTAHKKRVAGGLKGKVTIPDNFNEPLEDLNDYIS